MTNEDAASAPHPSAAAIQLTDHGGGGPRNAYGLPRRRIRIVWPAAARSM